MKRFTARSLCLLTVLFTGNVQADQGAMNQTLVQVVEQLQQLKPLIQQAAAEEPQDLSAQVHFTAFVGPNGQIQNGVMEDLNALQSGIEQIINLQQIDPKNYAPISGDYVGSN